MIRLRPLTYSVWLAGFALACGNSEESPDPGMGTNPEPTTTVPGTVGPAAPSNSLGVSPVTTAPVSPGGATGTTGVVPQPQGSTGGGTAQVGPSGGTAGVSPTTVGPTGPGATGPGPVGATGPGPDDTTGPGPGNTAPGNSSPVEPNPVTPPVDPTGAPTGEQPVDPVPEPSLIVSSNGNYWQEGEVAVVESGNANFTVDTATQHQTWHGWGGTFNEAGWDALQELSEADRQRAIDLLFDQNDGLGLDWGRIPIGPSDYAVERYTLSDASGNFSIAHDREYLIPYVKAAQAVKADVKYWASPWTPPPWAKTGGENGGYDKGLFNTEYYEEYADFFIAWIQAYEAEGIPIDHVMPQNEPGWAQSYPTCAFGPATDSVNGMDIANPVTLGTFVDGYLFPALDAADLETNVWFGTLSNNKFFSDYWGDMMNKPSASRIVGAGLQWETRPQVGRIADAGYLVMQSEHKCGNYPWLGEMASSPADATRTNFLAAMAPNNHAYGEESWDLMKSWIDDGVHIYSAWNMVLDTGGFNLDEVRKWPQNALLVVDRGAKSLQVTAYYYVFRHLAQYVDLQAKRVGINGDALAFQNPDGSVVAVMRTTAAGAQTVSIDGTLLQFEATGNGWVTVNWQGE